MARLPTPRLALVAALLVALVALVALPLAGCRRDTTCTAEVTEGAGTFKGASIGARPEADLKRDALHAACGKLCAARDPGGAEGCVSRCAVDAEAGKIGLRAACAKGGAR